MAKSPLLPQVIGDLLVVSLDGRRLGTIRADKGYTQLALAEATGLNSSFISQLERGIKKPALGTVQAIARVLEVAVSDITVTVPANGGAS